MTNSFENLFRSTQKKIVSVCEYEKPCNLGIVCERVDFMNVLIVATRRGKSLNIAILFQKFI